MPERTKVEVINDLLDVDVKTVPPEVKQILRWDGLNWVPDDETAGAGGAETDPVVGAINGIVKADGDGNISSANAGTDYQLPLPAQTGHGGEFLTTDGSNLSWDEAGAGAETDPVVGAVTGIVKADGGGNISAVVSGTDIKTINSTTLLGSGDMSLVASESDPVVAAINGIVKSNGATISAAVADTDYLNPSSVINKLADVDTVSDPPAKNEVLKWNGSQWIPAAYDASFTFSCTSFSDGESTPVLAGSGTWKAQSAMSYTAGYNNGPPTSASVKMSINGGTYNAVGAMTAPNYTTGTNSTSAVSYPTVDQYLRFRLDSSDGTDSDIDYDSAIYFNNYIFYGPSTTGSGFSEANVEALSSIISSSYTTSRSINAGASNYVVWAYASRYTSIHATGAIFNSVTMPFTAPEIVSVTNSAGVTENYKVFASTLTALGNSTLQLSTSSTTIDYIYWGELNKASGYTESDVENNYATQPGKVVSNTISSRSMVVNCAVNEYAYIAYPARLGALTSIVIGGFESISDFNVDNTALSITNLNGYAEDYRIYVSKNPGFTDPTTMTVSI
jgi:hypothetical protein